MFLGEYHHQLDDKGRVRIPPRFRELLGSDAVMMIGPEKCIMLYTAEEFEKRVYNRLSETDFMSLAAADIKRLLFSRTMPVEEDKQGRVQLNPLFLNECGIKKNVITIGVMDHAEIWDEEAYSEYRNGKDIKALFDHFGA